uniref:Fas-associated factor 1/2-like UAS domain-containing protein n=1 Tax=Ditylenchus dipsaci TaxID=166011 RepID=A0A915DMV8_9BILA
MQNFTSVFEARYGGNFAPFFQVVRSAMERRPLAIYLHNDTSIASNIFAQNVMCSESVSSLLKCQFIIWAWT